MNIATANEQYYNFIFAIECIDDVFRDIQRSTRDFDLEIEQLRVQMEKVLDNTIYHSAVYGWTSHTHLHGGFGSFYRAYERFTRMIDASGQA